MAERFVSFHPEDALPGELEDAWLSAREAVEYLASVGVRRTRATLAKWRVVGGGPPFEIAERRARYSKRVLHGWAMAELTRIPRRRSRRRSTDCDALESREC